MYNHGIVSELQCHSSVTYTVVHFKLNYLLNCSIKKVFSALLGRGGHRGSMFTCF